MFSPLASRPLAAPTRAGNLISPNFHTPMTNWKALLLGWHLPVCFQPRGGDFQLFIWQSFEYVRLYDGVVSLCSEKKKVLWSCEEWCLYCGLLGGVICHTKESTLKYVENQSHTSFMRRALLCHKEDKRNRKQAELKMFTKQCFRKTLKWHFEEAEYSVLFKAIKAGALLCWTLRRSYDSCGHD